MQKLLLLLTMMLGLTTAQAQQTTAGDTRVRAAVRQIALDYVDGFYQGDTAKLQRALDPSLSKYGMYRDSTGRWSGERMTYDEAIAYARRVKARGRPVPATWPREASVLGTGERTAVAKVRAWWGFDYLLLAQRDGEWKIMQVMWEGPPR
jgi:hypothetical protein